MVEQKSLPDTSLDDVNGLSFSPQEIRAELSFFLKQPPHKLPKASVDHVLEHYKKLVKKEREDKSLQGVLLELVITILKNPSGALSPRYIAVAEYARSKGVAIEEVSGKPLSAPPEAPAQTNDSVAQPADQVAPVAEETRNQVAAAFGDSESPSYKNRTDDIMDRNKSFDDAVRVIFPQISPMNLETIKLIMIQGPGPDEAYKIGSTFWLVNLFEDLMKRCPALKEELAGKISVESAARLLYMRHQLEVSSEQSKISERGRGKLDTVVGISVEDVKRSIVERGGAIPEGLAGPNETPQVVVDEITTEGEADVVDALLSQERASTPFYAPPVIEEKRDVSADDEDSRVTAIPQSKPDTKAGEIATVEIDTRAVRAQMATAVAMDPYVPPEAFRSEKDISDEDTEDRNQRITIPAPEEVDPGASKKKKGRVGRLFRRIVGGSSDGEE